MNRSTRVALAAALGAGAALTIAARSYAWHQFDQTGFTAPSGSLDLTLWMVSGMVLAAAVLLAVRPRAAPPTLVGAVALILASLLFATLLLLGDGADRPDEGAWLAGAAIFFLALAAACLLGSPRLPTRFVVATAVVVGVLATGAVVLPPDWPSDDVEVIR
jgi:hypothetical protein